MYTFIEVIKNNNNKNKKFIGIQNKWNKIEEKNKIKMSYLNLKSKWGLMSSNNKFFYLNESKIRKCPKKNSNNIFKKNWFNYRLNLVDRWFFWEN